MTANPSIYRKHRADACRLGDALSPHPEHVGDEVLRHDKIVAVEPVQAQEQPAAKLLIQGVMPIADRCLGHLREQSLRIAEQKVHHVPRSVEFREHEVGS